MARINEIARSNRPSGIEPWAWLVRFTRPRDECSKIEEASKHLGDDLLHQEAQDFVPDEGGSARAKIYRRSDPATQMHKSGLNFSLAFAEDDLALANALKKMPPNSPLKDAYDELERQVKIVDLQCKNYDEIVKSNKKAPKVLTTKIIALASHFCLH